MDIMNECQEILTMNTEIITTWYIILFPTITCAIGVLLGYWLAVKRPK